MGAEAGLLALFFATVGVIALTAYARVPGEIRQLFVRERTSLIYVWNVAVALLVGLVVLTMPLVAHRWPHGLTVLLFAVMTAFSVLSLAVLGTRLFSFFDLSTLSLPLRRRFQRGARAASAAGRSVPSEAQQEAAHDGAAYLNRIGVDARADRLEVLTAALVRRRMPVARWYGVRVFTDTAASDALVPDDATLDSILQFEERAGRTDPYRHVAALLHLIAVRGGEALGS